MMRVVVLAALVAVPVVATSVPAAEAAREMPASFTAISPIFGQLVAFSQPSNFVPAFEDTQADSYIREVVLKGESVDHWTQMITVTGAKGLAANPDASPVGVADFIASGFKKACPETFSAEAIGDLKIEGHDAFAAVTSCGSVDQGASAHQETALIIAIKGASDYYTIQWAERGKAVNKEPAIDTAVWTQRMKELGPIRLCPIVSGEKPPYPSCLDQH